MKRITKKRKTKKIREDALKQLRETRAHLEKEHPQLLEKIRKIVEKANQAPERESTEMMSGSDEMISIDRKKNLEAILKYAALKPGSEKLKQELKDFLN